MALKRGMAAALALSCALLLTGCSSLLENPYAVVEPHTERPATAEDSSAVQAGTYSELVNTVLFFVSQGTEKGLIQLTDDYDGDVEEDLNRACLEVAKDDPLGAYAVDFIKNDCTKVLTTYEATITISYRRTREQIRSLVNVTGTSAIRDEVRAALADFQSEVALRVGYFTESADSIAALVRQAYYDEPAGALGMPEFTVSLYPASGGQQRIVEVLLTYPEDTQALRQKSDDLQSTADALVLPLRPHQLSPSARQAELFSLVREHVRARPEGGPTAWDALLGDGADSEGLALTFQLLSGKMEVGSVLVEGTLNGEPHFWNQLTADGGAHYVDLTRDASGTTYSAADLLSLGYVWEGAEENAENLN